MVFQLEISRYQNLVSKFFDPKIKLSQFVSGMHPSIFRCSWSLQIHAELFSTLQHPSIWCKGQKSTFHLEILKSKVWSKFFLTKNKLIPICFRIVSASFSDVFATPKGLQYVFRLTTPFKFVIKYFYLFMSLNGVVGLKIMLHPNTSESFEETILKTIKANQFLDLKKFALRKS